MTVPGGRDPHRWVAAVDLGSVSTQVLLTNGIERIRRSADTLMGGSELSPAGEVRGRAISGEALERVALALRDFAELLDRHPSTPAKRVVATESARQALNRNELADLVAAILGCDLHVIDGAEEARLSFSGAVSDLALSATPELAGPPPAPTSAARPDQHPVGSPHPVGPARPVGSLEPVPGSRRSAGAGPGAAIVTIDVGGGSTGLALGTVEGPVHTCSVPIGGVVLTDAYLTSDPPRPDELSAALSVVELHLDDVRREHPELVAALGSATVLGLGAVDTIAAIEVGLAGFDPGNGEGDGPLHGFELSRLAVEDVFRTIATEGRADRAHNPGLPPARVDAAVGACAVLVETMRQFGLDQITVSQRGLLDGVAREMIDHGG